jgi:hypothetical protein
MEGPLQPASDVIKAYTAFLKAQLVPPLVTMQVVREGVHSWTVHMGRMLGRATQFTMSSNAMVSVGGVQVASGSTFALLAVAVLDSRALTASQYAVLLPYLDVIMSLKDFSIVNDRDSPVSLNDDQTSADSPSADSPSADSFVFDWALYQPDAVRLRALQDVARHPACPWRLQVFAEILAALPVCGDLLPHTTTRAEVDSEARARAPALNALLRNAAGRGWCMHGWFARVVAQRTFDARELRVGIVQIARLVALGLSPDALLKRYLPGDGVWELALLTGAWPDGRYLSKLNRECQWSMAPNCQHSEQALGGYAWPLWGEYSFCPTIDAIRKARWAAWMPHFVHEEWNDTVSAPRNAWAVCAL